MAMAQEPAATADPGRRERKRQQTLDHLAATAFGLFQAHGYDAVTMEQIAMAADVAKGTLYNHFPLKEALLAHQFHAELATNAATMREALAAHEGVVARLSTFLAESARWCEARREYLPHYLRFRFAADVAARGERAARSGIDRWFEALVAAGQAGGELRDDRGAGQLATLLQHLYLGAMLRWLADDTLVLADEFAAVVDVFVDGARRRPARSRR